MEMCKMSLASKRKVLEESMDLIKLMEKWAESDNVRKYVVLAALEGMSQLRDIPERL